MNIKTIIITVLCLLALINPISGTIINTETPCVSVVKINDINTNEGEVTLLTITVLAKSGGTINLYGDGPGEESISWVGGSQKSLEAGELYTFQSYIKSSQVDVDSKLPITIYFQPSGMGIASQITFYNTIRDTENLEKHHLIVKCVDHNGEIVKTAEIYMDNVFLGYGIIRKDNVIEGEHRIFAKDTRLWKPGYTEDNPKVLYIENDMMFTLASTPESSLCETNQKTPFLNSFITFTIFIIISIILRKSKSDSK